MGKKTTNHATASPSNQSFVYTYKKSWFLLMRPLTFTGTISPILAGTAVASLKSSIDVHLLIILLIAALFIQASANMLNDYFDFINGQDYDRWIMTKKRNDLSPSHSQIIYVACMFISIAVILGIYLSVHVTWWIAGIGLVSIVASFAYSAGKHSLAARGLGEIVAAIFLGIMPTILAYIIQGHNVDQYILMVAFPFSILIASMILANNIRDIKKDEGFRLTIAIKMGRKQAALFLKVLLILAYVWVFILITLQLLPWTTSLIILAIPLAYRLSSSYHRQASCEDENRGMMWAATHHWGFGLLFASGLWLVHLI